MKIDVSSFAPGDVVQLKSLGPAMTVVALREDGVEAVWYDEVDGDVKSRVVPAVALVKIDLSILEDDEDEDDDDEEEEDEWREEQPGGRSRKKRGRG
ncbi:YodC family protein [Methylocella sp.]|uniref:YodC family protein n=1 Tax=Methylocella sp. TaxID=1978226 RepID=UPI0035AFAB63